MVKTLRSLIQEKFPMELRVKIELLSRRRDITNKEKQDELFKLLREYEIENIVPLGPGTNRYAFKLNGFVIKVATDHDGKIDNLKEFKMAKRLYPYVTKTYEVSENGTLLVAEYIQPFSSYGEMLNYADKIREILTKLSSVYLIGDVGITSKNFANWGLRIGGTEPVCLDFAYVYEVSSELFICKHCKSGSMLVPNKDFTELVCPQPGCGKKYLFEDIRSKIGNDIHRHEIGDLTEEGYLLSESNVTTELSTGRSNYLVRKIKPSSKKSIPEKKEEIVLDNFVMEHEPSYYNGINGNSKYFKEDVKMANMDLLREAAADVAKRSSDGGLVIRAKATLVNKKPRREQRHDVKPIAVQAEETTVEQPVEETFDEGEESTLATDATGSVLPDLSGSYSMNESSEEETPEFDEDGNYTDEGSDTKFLSVEIYPDDDVDVIKVKSSEAFGDVSIPFYTKLSDIDLSKNVPSVADDRNGIWDWLIHMVPDIMFYTQNPDRYLEINEYDIEEDQTHAVILDENEGTYIMGIYFIEGIWMVDDDGNGHQVTDKDLLARLNKLIKEDIGYSRMSHLERSLTMKELIRTEESILESIVQEVSDEMEPTEEVTPQAEETTVEQPVEETFDEGEESTLAFSASMSEPERSVAPVEEVKVQQEEKPIMETVMKPEVLPEPVVVRATAARINKVTNVTEEKNEPVPPAKEVEKSVEQKHEETEAPVDESMFSQDFKDHIDKVFSIVSNKVGTDLHIRAVFDDVKGNIRTKKMFPEQFYKGVQNAVFRSLMAFCNFEEKNIPNDNNKGYHKSFTPPSELEDMTYTPTMIFMSRIWADKSLYNMENPEDMMRAYRDKFSDYDGFQPEWIEIFKNRLRGKIQIDESGLCKVADAVSEVWVTRFTENVSDEMEPTEEVTPQAEETTVEQPVEETFDEGVEREREIGGLEEAAIAALTGTDHERDTDLDRYESYVNNDPQLAKLAEERVQTFAPIRRNRQRDRER